MKSLRIENGLLLTEMRLSYSGKALDLKRVLVDTCATHSVVATSTAIELDIPVKESLEEKEKVSTAISVGPLKIADFPIRVVELTEEGLDGILGLDFLKRVGAKINLDSMTLSGSRVQ